MAKDEPPATVEETAGAPAALAAEVARLQAALDAAETCHKAVSDELQVRVETLESRRRSLEQTLEAYADLYDFAPVPYLALDGAGLIRDANLTATTMLQAERERVVGWPLRHYIAPVDRRLFLDHMVRCRRTHAQVVCELRLQPADGRVLPVQLISRRATVSPDQGITFRTVIVDLSERRQAEEAQRRGHQRLELAIAASGAGLFESTWPTGQLTVSQRWAQILGHDPALLPDGSALASWWDAQIDPDQRDARAAAFAGFLAGEVATHAAELRVRHASGRWLWVRELAQVADREPSGRIRRVVGVMVDVTEVRTRLSDAHERTVQLQSLAAALFHVEENERRELATLVHDDLGQRLVAIKLRLAAVDHAALPPVMALLDDTHATIRSLAFQLSPPILRDLGLVAGLRWLAREFTDRYGVEFAVEDDGPLPPLAGDFDVALFRCVRELLFNTVKHARATRASVQVITAVDELAVHLVVEDDGVGFDPDTELAASRSFGLLSVRERLGWLGGDMQIESEPGRGARVRLIVPRMSALAHEADDGLGD